MDVYRLHFNTNWYCSLSLNNIYLFIICSLSLNNITKWPITTKTLEKYLCNKSESLQQLFQYNLPFQHRVTSIMLNILNSFRGIRNSHYSDISFAFYSNFACSVLDSPLETNFLKLFQRYSELKSIRGWKQTICIKTFILTMSTTVIIKIIYVFYERLRHSFRSVSRLLQGICYIKLNEVFLKYFSLYYDTN